jgi:hypothetical protein
LVADRRHHDNKPIAARLLTQGQAGKVETRLNELVVQRFLHPPQCCAPDVVLRAAIARRVAARTLSRPT